MLENKRMLNQSAKIRDYFKTKQTLTQYVSDIFSVLTAIQIVISVCICPLQRIHPYCRILPWLFMNVLIFWFAISLI